MRSLALAFVTLLVISSAQGQIVSNTADSGAGSLRQAIADVGEGGQVVFQSSLAGSTIALQTPLNVDKSITINATITFEEGITLDGSALDPGESVIETGLPATSPSLNIAFVTAYVGGAVKVDTPDLPYTDFLTTAGHTVTRWKSGNEPQNRPANDTDGTLADLNAADLVIISRTTNDSHFKEATEMNFWNTQVTTPVISLNPLVIKKNRLTMTDSNSLTHADGDAALDSDMEDHPIFEGVTWRDSNLGDDPRILAAYVELLPGHRGTTFNPGNAIEGTVLARATQPRADFGVVPLNAEGAPAIIEYADGATMRNGEVLASPRLVFITGNRSGLEPGFETGQYDLTALGEQIFVNCINYMANRPAIVLKGLMVDGGDVAQGINNQGADLTLEGCTVREGASSGGGGLASIGKLTVTESAVHDSAASAAGGGIWNRGFLEINDSDIYNNTATDHGGGVHSTGVTIMKESSVYENEAARGGGLSSGSSLSMRRSTIRNNTATAEGGGLYSSGICGVFNTTIHENNADDGGGIFAAAGEMDVEHLTIANNSAVLQGGGVTTLLGEIRFANCLIASNTVPDGVPGPDVMRVGVGEVKVGGSIIISSLSDSSLIAERRILEADPLLGTLADNGGKTQTVPLLAGSPAIDFGRDSSSTVEIDQRGLPRTGADPDVGAFESGADSAYGVYAVANLPEGGLIAFYRDIDLDGLVNGLEYGLGMNPVMSDAHSDDLPVTGSGTNLQTVTFGIDPSATDVDWVLKRSDDADDYIEIYRYEGGSGAQTLTTGVTAQVNADNIVVSDTTAISPRLFYLLVIEHTP